MYYKTESYLQVHVIPVVYGLLVKKKKLLNRIELTIKKNESLLPKVYIA